jgi:hypothetical protein
MKWTIAGVAGVRASFLISFAVTQMHCNYYGDGGGGGEGGGKGPGKWQAGGAM